MNYNSGLSQLWSKHCPLLRWGLRGSPGHQEHLQGDFWNFFCGLDNVIHWMGFGEICVVDRNQRWRERRSARTTAQSSSTLRRTTDRAVWRSSTGSSASASPARRTGPSCTRWPRMCSTSGFEEKWKIWVKLNCWIFRCGECGGSAPFHTSSNMPQLRWIWNIFNIPQQVLRNHWNALCAIYPPRSDQKSFSSHRPSIHLSLEESNIPS